LTPVDPVTNQTGFGSIDGSTFNPFTFKLLFTQEAGASGGVFEEARAPSSLDAFLGKAGYEGIHPDSEGNIYIIEDTGGATSHTPAINNGRQPNFFVIPPGLGTAVGRSFAGHIRRKAFGIRWRCCRRRRHFFDCTA